VFSPTLYVTTCTPPTEMTTITVDSIYPKAITISWTNVTTNNGGDPVTYYAVWGDSGTGNLVHLNSASTSFALTYTHTSTSNFPANTVFNYKVIAKNDVGFGAFSTVTATTDNVPQSMTSPSLVGTVLYNSITISWSDLTDTVANGGDSVIYYEVRYKSSAGGTYTALTT